MYGADELPVLVEGDVHGEIGGVRELIGDYIANVKNGVIYPECDDNWRITGRE
jgi:2',3'-cyclic-nucleotide 2'-phosphodiesterase/3'-nucleotidase